MNLGHVLSAIMVTWLAGLAGGSLAHAAPAALEVRFSWRDVPACSHESPQFVVLGVPAGTTALQFALQDLQAPGYPHGGGTVRYTGSSAIPAGAFRYNGPCPPAGARHTYRWTIRAVDAAGRELAETEITRQYPP